MRVAVFGGSFNPPHVGHQLAALWVLETAEIDELWLIPTLVHPFDKALAPFEDRFRMCERAALSLGPRVRVSDVEARLGGPSRTLRTIETLMEASSGVTFSLVIGADLVAESSTWYGAERLRQLVPFIVVGRQGRGPAVGAPAEGGADPIAIPDVSSTAIRAALAAGQPVGSWVPRRVLEYIREHRLYGADASASPSGEPAASGRSEPGG
jgi:nicotinate-nucleotide adenylyltransferase